MDDLTPQPIKVPPWAVAVGVLSALILPFALYPLWPGGAFFAGLIPAAFLTVLYSAAPSELQGGVALRSKSGWERAFRRACIAAAICLGMAILNDWWGVRFS